MKLLVLGSTGKTGQFVLAAAARAGHTVTVLVRDPAKLPSIAGLTVLTGDASSAADVTRAAAGQDAVISAVGGGYSTTTDIASRAAKALVAAKPARVVVLSAFGAGPSRAKCSFLQKIAFGTVMNRVYDDKAIGDRLLRETALDWTIVQPVTFSEKPATGHPVLTDLDALDSVDGFPKVPREDVGAALVAIAGDAAWSRKTVVVT
ncbi:MAG: NAD(P)-binding oxidoreductase, partial [Pseudolysinimonas sp.]